MFRRFARVSAGALVLLSLNSLGLAADPIPLPGKIDSVTVYRGQALVTRLVDVAAPPGLTEILVTNLPDRVIPGSVYAESSDGVEVRSVSYREHPVSQDIRQEVQVIDRQIRADQDAIDAESSALRVLALRGKFLDNLEGFTSATAVTELSKGILDAETLKTLSLYIFDQRQAISTDGLDLARKMRDSREQLNLHQRQRLTLTGSSSMTAREADVLVNFTRAGGQLRVHYLVDQADWTASYIARGNPAQQSVRLEYDASVRQMSGEDWPSVDMILSTATPSLVATAPQLDPLEIALESVPATDKVYDAALPPPQDYSDARKALVAEQQSAELERNGDQLALNGPVGTTGARNMGGRGGGGGGAAGRDVRGGAAGGAPAGLGATSSGNSAVDDLLTQQRLRRMKESGQLVNGADTLAASTQPSQMFDVYRQQDRQAAQAALDQNLKDVSRQLQVLELVTQAAKSNAPSEGHQSVSVTYHLARTSVPSRNDEQLIQIAALPLKGSFYKTAMPVLTSFVYDQASVVNDAKIVLLAGPVSSYQNEQFVGVGQIPTVSMGESLTLGFGIDSSLRASRELIDKTDDLQAGNRVLSFNYKLSIENFGADPAVVRLMDRIPTSKASEARITPIGASRDLSADPEYVATDKTRGILRWDVTVPGQVIGDKAVTVSHQFRVEYDKQLSISASSFSGR
jgi:hypothetical protein